MTTKTKARIVQAYLFFDGRCEEALNFNAKALEGENSAIPRKYVELIAMGIALTTQCAYCIEIHAAAARDEGVTQQELAETVMIASSLRAGGSFAHGFMAMKFFEQAEASATQA